MQVRVVLRAAATAESAAGGTKMDTKKLIPIIAMVSVLVMFVLMYAGVQQSWLAVFAGGIIIAAISMLGKGKKKDDSDKKE